MAKRYTLDELVELEKEIYSRACRARDLSALLNNPRSWLNVLEARWEKAVAQHRGYSAYPAEGTVVPAEWFEHCKKNNMHPYYKFADLLA